MKRYNIRYIYLGQVSIEEAEIPNGIGRAIMDDNTIHEGFFQNGHLNGYGRSIYPDGTFYEGMYTNGKRHGDGKFTTQCFDENKRKYIQGGRAKKVKKFSSLHKKWAIQDGIPYNEENLSSEYESEVDSDDKNKNKNNYNQHDPYDSY